MTETDVQVDLDEVRTELRQVARQVIAERCPPPRVRELADDRAGFDERLWRDAAELGWLGLEIPEAYGGSGMTFRELGVTLDELGRGVVPLPLLSTAVLGAGALLVAGSGEQRATWLPALAAGERRVTAGLTGPSARYDVDAIAVRAASVGHGLRLDGMTSFVPDAHVADAVIVAAHADEGLLLVLVPMDAVGVSVDVTPTLDQTRRLCEVRLDRVEVGRAAQLGDHGAALLEWLIDRAAVALALDSSGGARRAMEVSVDYAKERVQFGRPIGSFQAVKHHCANMLVNVETAQVAAEAGARELPARPGGRSPWPSIAKPHAADAYASVAGDGIRVHGGIGFTWEHDMHLYLKRAKLNQALFGTSAWHRERLARLVIDGDGSTAP